MRITIRYKFLIIFLFILFALVFIAQQGLRNSSKMNHRLQSMYQENVIGLQEFSQLQADLHRLKGDLLEYRVATSPESRREEHQNITEQLARINQHLQDLTQNRNINNRSQNELQTLRKNWQQTAAFITRFTTIGTSATPAGIDSFLRSSLFPAFDQLTSQMNGIMQTKIDRARQTLRQSSNDYNREKQVAYVSIGFLVALSIIFSLLASSKLSRTIRYIATTAHQIAQDELPQLTDGIRKLSEGNLTSEMNIDMKPVTIRQNDELGDLGHAFNEMIDQLQQTSQSFQETMRQMQAMIRKLIENTRVLNDSSDHLSVSSEQSTQAIEQVSIAIHQVAQGASIQNTSIYEAKQEIEHITQAMEEIATGAQDQAASIERVAASITQMASQIQEVSESVRISAELSRHTEQSAKEGASTIDHAIELMMGIRESVEAVASQVDSMLHYTNQVNTILETIEEIADQTNLLSINAAIEAAQAGAHGKGFAVVAEEVRKLAERSGEATRKIAKLITNIQQGTQQTKKTMDQSVLQVEKGAQEAANAKEALNRILNSIVEVSNKVEQIAGATSEMAIASNDVEQAMNSVSSTVEESSHVLATIAQSSKKLKASMDEITRVSQENSAAAEEVSAMTEEMSAQIVEINNSVRDMKQVAQQIYTITSRFQLGETSPSNPDTNVRLYPSHPPETSTQPQPISLN